MGRFILHHRWPLSACHTWHLQTCFWKTWQTSQAVTMGHQRFPPWDPAPLIPYLLHRPSGFWKTCSRKQGVDKESLGNGPLSGLAHMWYVELQPTSAITQIKRITMVDVRPPRGAPTSQLWLRVLGKPTWPTLPTRVTYMFAPNKDSSCHMFESNNDLYAFLPCSKYMGHGHGMSLYSFVSCHHKTLLIVRYPFPATPV